MGTKTEEELAYEAFKQELLHTTNWGLRRLALGPKGAGIDVEDMKKADETGPEAVVELILEKYDEGWRPGGVTLNAQSKPAPAKTAPKAESEPDPDDSRDAAAVIGEDAAEAAEESGNPWDDIGTDDGDLNLDDDAPEPEPEPEPDPKPKPQKRQHRTTKAKTPPAGESSALEEKIDKTLDTLMKMATVIAKLEQAMNAIDAGVQEIRLVVVTIEKINTTALGGIFNRLAISKYSDVVSRAKRVANDICGIKG